MNCQPVPTDVSGIFRCRVCGKQNPHPIEKPFHARCGVYEPPEPPYDADTAKWILENLCGLPCDKLDGDRCGLRRGCNKSGVKIATMLARGVCCPELKW